MSHFYKRIGKRIKKHRLQKGYTIEELAVLIDVESWTGLCCRGLWWCD